MEKTFKTMTEKAKTMAETALSKEAIRPKTG
jgi:hypothetical protein